MNKLIKKYGPWLIIALVVIGAVWWSRAKHETASPSPAATGNQAAIETSAKTDSAQTAEGILKYSNNLKNGNLMLLTSTRTVYIFTSRDFSSLINKEVVMTYEGTLDNFRLGNITAK